MRFSCFRFAPNEFWKNILGLLGLFAARRILPPRTDRVPGNIHLHTAHKLRFEYFRDTWCWVSMTSVIRDVKCPWLHLFAFVRKRSRQACKLLFNAFASPFSSRSCLDDFFQYPWMPHSAAPLILVHCVYIWRASFEAPATRRCEGGAVMSGCFDVFLIYSLEPLR